MATNRERDLAVDLQNFAFDLLGGVKSEADVAHEIRPWAELLDSPAATGSAGLRLLSVEDLAALPPLQWLVDGMLPAESLIMLFGAPGAGKSFLALDLACAIASGRRSWLGQESRVGGVLYLAAEGVAGLPQRLEAAQSAHGYTAADLAPLRFVIEPVHLLERTPAAQLEACAQSMDPATALVIVDTVARTLGGKNDVDHMGDLIEAADRIRRIGRTAVLLLHHPNAGGDRERGHTRGRGDVATTIELKLDDDRRILHCRKQKDAAEFSPIALDLVPTLNSCVIYRSREGLDAETNSETSLTGKTLESLKALSEIALDRGATSSEWEAAAEAHSVSRASYMRARKSLLEQGYVSEREKGNSHRYSLTDSGRHAVGLMSHARSHAGLNGQVSQSQRYAPPVRGATSETRPNPESDTDDYEQQERLAMESGS